MASMRELSEFFLQQSLANKQARDYEMGAARFERDALPTPAQTANFGGAMAPGAAFADMMGRYPMTPDRDAVITEAFSEDYGPSLIENLDEGNYTDAFLQGLGGLGDLATIAGPVGVAAGSLLKLPRAVKASRGGAMPANQVGAIGDFTPANIITPNVSNAVSSRFPVAKGRVDDPLQEILLSDTAEMPKELLAKNAEVIRDYPGMGRLRSNASTDTIMGEFADLVGGNLMKVWDEMPTEMRDRAAQWYEGANKIRRGLANEYGISDAQASGIIAVLSPQNPWDNNVAAAERMIDIYKNNIMSDNFKTSSEMMNWYKADKAKRKPKNGKKSSPFDPYIKEIQGKSLGELKSDKAKAAWIRMYDEAHNSREFPLWTPEGKRSGNYKTGKGEDATMSWGSFNEMSNAISILEDGSLKNISEKLGVQHKVRNFYNNIENPQLPEYYTSDTHNVAAGLLRPLGGSAKEVAQSFGAGPSSSITGHKGTYGLYHDAGNRMAEAQGVLPRQVQSVVWEGVRELFPAADKKRLKPIVDNIWKEYDAGKISVDQARELTFEAAEGITPPQWLGK